MQQISRGGCPDGQSAKSGLRLLDSAVYLYHNSPSDRFFFVVWLFLKVVLSNMDKCPQLNASKTKHGDIIRPLLHQN